MIVVFKSSWSLSGAATVVTGPGPGHPNTTLCHWFRLPLAGSEILLCDNSGVWPSFSLHTSQCRL